LRARGARADDPRGSRGHPRAASGHGRFEAAACTRSVRGRDEEDPLAPREESTVNTDPEDRALMEAMLPSGRSDGPAPNLEGRVRRGLARRSALAPPPEKRGLWSRARARKVPIAIAVAAVAAAALFLARREPRRPEISAEPASHIERKCLRAA